eukprot:CAMPEP_0172555494 /NCGR_PEP_ID=MMETSP1067-20121228/58449_1 /TAXON_ID=265564 ORGANISM="Thalassiosira punctigera, Strain Tpunct2005C2" /NCGR_SAMPLE_ID=MMETSP1067 /ASSEMBLY_ACC=CAM_ASM_000444 /LENGTH=144 /DNA_ID=CAMNT_0013344017 /DNA_START=63 /DNA_END=497 /DNA_ORIENTATION=-
MIIPIRAPANVDSVEKVEWVMIELNGELSKPHDESRRTSQAASSSSGAVDGSGRRVELGSVKFDADGDPTLIIGNHQLRGKTIKLKEQFAVLRKRKSIQITKNDDSEEGTSEAKLKKHCGVELEVVGVVKKKLMFDQYPKSIMR